jgi:hypothetical protein
VRGALSLVRLLFARRCCEFMASGDAELDRAASRAIFLHERDKYQTVDGFLGLMRGLEALLAGINKVGDATGVL